MTTLSLRRLNRTLLHRQQLDVRSDGGVVAAVRRRVAVQAQEPNWVHVGMWARLAGFRTADLDAAVEARTLVRAPLLRGTQHLTAAADHGWLRPTVQPVLDRLVRAPYYAEHVGDLDPAVLVAAAREVLGDATVRRRDLGAALVERFPGRKAAVVAAAVEALTPVVHDPATSAFGSWWSRRSIAVTAADAWLGAPVGEPDVPALVRRYLAAFGPAGVMDLQAWCGLTRLRPVVDAMRGELRVLHGPDGRELLDVPDGPLADEDAPAPVRFLPMFDDAVLAHRDRGRILPEAVRRDVMPGWSMVRATVLVDGFVAATWELAEGRVVVRPLRPLTPAERDAVGAEGAAAAAFVGADPEIRLTSTPVTRVPGERTS
ncbi:winged helix DNA-binding domain-containing protein [Cellulomonas shaoxiangyii]|uniref:Winged helix DNA-binding domain-containing protein n=1 Tax=Cellulomonas shaoxiangyii TaxID=2566013 RepID=A0A4P7SIJ4_9CELL|nr:winged helix DNA-binding domain-containing protein [Cellulomonas shaoxiangyii]QCB92273.1 winged helix DNA-binding domain-containing protein [Cellulomonas shaoxiangyii]TGY85915.1 winged helix DNA-binding domain-containing protein [Cellulomonas shaoxiangyii]